MKERRRKKMIDYKRNNRVVIRTATDAFLSHETIKFALVFLLRKKHPDNNACQIYTEHALENQNEYYPDIEMRLRKGWRKEWEVYAWEIQKEISPMWRQKMNDRYENINAWFEVDLKKIETQWKKECKTGADPMKVLCGILEKGGYVI